MYTVYIKNFERNGSTVTDWEEMFTVPSSGGFPVNNPSVKASEDSAENLSFTMEMNSPYYSALLPLKTIIRVEYDGDIIFMGRVFMVSTSSVYHTKNITCQGVLSYFNDTYYEGKSEKKRSKITTSTYFQRIIDNHNNNVPSDKEIHRGNLIGISLPSDKEQFEPSSWSQTMSLLNGLTNANGGHFIIRYSGTTPYLDWYKYYNRDLGKNGGTRQSVTVGRNILDISSEQNVADVFTRLIPIGGTDSSSGNPKYIDGYKYTDKNGNSRTHSGKALKISDLSNYLYTDSQLNDEFHKASDYRDAESLYGVIYKTVDFPNADSQSKLWNVAKKWAKECFFGLNRSFTVKAIDMHIQDSSVPKILLGDFVDVTYKIVQNGVETWDTRPLVCKAVTYDLFNPENNSYSFGIPSDLLEYNKFNKKKTTSPTVTDPPKPSYSSPQVDNDWTWMDVGELIGSELEGDPDYQGTLASDSYFANGEIKGRTGNFVNPTDNGSDGNPIGDTWVRILANKDKWFTAKIIGKITIPGKSTKWVGISSERGIFAYRNMQYPCNPVTFWYKIKNGINYTGDTNNEDVSFEDIANMIRADTTTGYGGDAAADNFIANGKKSSTAVCVPDITSTDTPASIANKQFTATVVGFFKLQSNPTRYVAHAANKGVFAFSDNGNPKKVLHWYKHDNSSYTPPNNMTNDGNGNTYGTNNGLPDGNQTVSIQPTQMSTINWPDWSSSKKYKKGAVVKRNGKVYICKPAKDSQGNERRETGPGWDAADWQEVPGYSSTSQGTVSVGYNTTGQGDTWRIHLNTPIVYTGDDGNTYVADGGVSASDFQVREVPSFRTRLAVVDVLVAGVINATEVNTKKLNAIDAYVKSLKGENADIVNVVAGHVSANEVFCNHIKINTPGSGSIEPGSCLDTSAFCSCSVKVGTGTTADNLKGHIYFTFYTVWGAERQTINFSIADTETYQEAVSAAQDKGWNGARAVINNSLPKSGDEQEDTNTDWTLKIPNLGYNSGSTNLKLTVTNVAGFTDGGGTTHKAILAKLGSYVAYAKLCDTLIPTNVKDGVTILGVKGTYTASHNVTVSPSLNGSATDPGSGYGELWSSSTWKFTKNYWYKFDVYCGGKKQKSYKFKLKQ